MRTYMLAAMLAEKRVVSSFGSRFSIPFALASILHHGRSGLASFDDAAVANAKCRRSRSAWTCRRTPHTARYPEEKPCELAIVIADGTAEAAAPS